MTIHLPEDLEQFVHDAVRSGLYAREDDVVREALEQFRSHALLRSPAKKPLTEAELEQKLIESGFLASVPPPHDPSTPAWSFAPVKIEGEPLSETVIRERR